MSRPYPGYDDGSPLTPSAGTPSTPISYSANVNRQKTKKWIEAKAPDYGGDDWGDEYGDGSEPPSSLKPTGLRQSGQGSGSGMLSEGVKKSYGDLPVVPAENQTRSTTMAPKIRTNSFGQDDERRTFSSGHTPLSATAPKMFSEMLLPSTTQPSQLPALKLSTQHPSVTGLRKPIQQSSPIITQPSQHVGREEPESRTSSKYTDVSKPSEMRTPASDIRTGRDLSPPSMGQPVHARYSPVPQSATSETPSIRFPPRKSSMSSNPPDLADITHSSKEVQKPWSEPRSASPSGSARSLITDKKALPFIRPADIYKRMEEERERERQSIDSSRPSMDSLGGRVGDRSVSPARGAFQALRAESPGSGYRKGTGSDADRMSDSGRRQVLEPVRERKSEYGLESFDPLTVPVAPKPSTPEISHPRPRYSEDDGEDERRFSSSPKIPEIGRMSGFGMDIFAQRSPGSAPEIITNTATESDDAHLLHTQPSVGVTSIVHQAFDTEIPEAPASATGSRVKKTDNESTGTTSISPIINRNTGMAVNQDVDKSRLASVPGIEELEEPQSTQVSPQSPQAPQALPVPKMDNKAPQMDDISDDDELTPSIRPGHRRNTSTPTPGHSPATTPYMELASTRGYQMDEEAQISKGSEQPLSSLNTLPQPSRPFAEREPSFRPQIPGGWTSYATTESDAIRGNEAPNSEEQVVPVSPLSDSDEELEHTPTANRRLPQVTLGAAAAGVASAAFAHSDKSQPPIPNAARAPPSNMYSFTAAQERHVSGSNTHLNVPLEASRDVSAASSAPPTPPPKDTPDDGGGGSAGTEYFPPHVPLKQRTQDEIAARETLEPLMRPQVLPTLSTATSPQDEENDKLRKEIVKSLNPGASESGPRPIVIPETEEAAPGTRESTYLPSEYENYWASTDDEQGQRNSQLTGRGDSNAGRPDQTELPVPSFTKQSPETVLVPPIPPLSPKRQSIEYRRLDAGNRFSWEAGQQEATSPVPAPLNISRPGTGQGTTPDSQHRQLDETTHAYFEQTRVDTSVNASGGEASIRKPAGAADENSLTSHGIDDAVSEPSSTHSRFGKEAALMAGGVGAGAAAGAVYARHEANKVQPQRRLSLAEEKSPVNTSTYAVAQTPPEDEHPARSPQTLVSPVSAGSGPPSLHPVQTHVPARSGAPPGQETTKILQFKQILSMQNQHSRIKSYNETRTQFLNMDTGLSDWLASIGEQHRQMGEPSANFGHHAKPNFPKSSSSSPAAPALQQPYYQQYLNASPTTSRPETASLNPVFPAGTQQGFAPGPGPTKLSSQQVGAKSKELLHSAGVFGGKASKAGKGLFTKGKNRLRGAGGDKDDSPPPSIRLKVKEGRRSSWGISSLTLPRSSTKNDASSQHSRDRSSQHSTDDTPTRPPHSRTPSMPLQLETSYQREVSLWDAPVSAVSTPSVPNSVPVSIAQPHDTHHQHMASDTLQSIYANSAVAGLRDNDKEERDTLGVPAPIGKHQPSWDPYNATPIVEEEGFQSEGSSNPHNKILATSQLDVPERRRALDSSSDRSDSGETAYLSAQERHSEAAERPSDGDDWVLVTKDDSTQTQGEISSLSAALNVPVIARGMAIDDVASPHTEMKREAMLSTVTSQPGSIPVTSATREAVVEVQEIETPSGEFPSSKGPAVQELFIPQSVTLAQNHDAQYAPLSGLPPQQITRAPVQEYAPPPGPPPGLITSRQAEPQMLASQYQNSIPAAQTSPKPIYEQSKQERYSYSPAFSPPKPSEIKQQAHVQAQRDEPAPNRQPQVAPATGGLSNWQGLEPQDPSQPGFVGLPPIRRSSTFGLGFGKKEKQRFPIDDDEPVPPVPSGGVSGAGMQQAPASNRYSWVEESRADGLGRPAIVHQSSSNYDQSTISSGAPTLSSKDVRQLPQTTYATPARGSQDGWRPNPNPQHPSVESQRLRSGSGSDRSYMIMPGTVSAPIARPPSYQQKPFDQPPSSAQRYPELFRPEQLDKDDEKTFDRDMPAHHYQPPLSREEAFLPRNQTNEYQLPGVGPPEDPPSGGRSSRRNSAILKEIGGRLSRSVSRTRGSNHDRDLLDDEDDLDMRSPGRILESRNTELSTPSIASFDTTGQKKTRRSSFFGAISRASTGGQAPPSRGESMLAHAPGSRTDLRSSVGPAEPSPLGMTDRKRSLFGGSSKTPEAIRNGPNKLTRASTGMVSDQSGKKKRFSGLSSIFGGRPTGDQENRRPGSSSQVMGGPPAPFQAPHPRQVQNIPQGAPLPQALRSPPGGPDPQGRLFLQQQMPQGQPSVSHMPPFSHSPGPQPRQGESPQPHQWQVSQQQRFQFTQHPTNFQREAPPGNPIPPTENTPVIPPDPDKKAAGAPPMFQPAPKQPHVQQANQRLSQQTQSSALQEQSLQNVPEQAPQSVSQQIPQNLLQQSPQNLQQIPPNMLRQGPPFPQGQRPLQSVVQPHPQVGHPMAKPPQQQGLPTNFQRQSSQLSQPIIQGPQGQQVYQRQPSISTLPALVLQGQHPQHGPMGRGQAVGMQSADYPRQIYGGQTALPHIQNQMPPAQRQTSTEKPPQSQNGGPRRSSSAQRKLIRPSPTQKEKSKDKTTSTSRLFGGLLSKRTSNDKLSKNNEQSQIATSPGPQTPQQWAGQAPPQILPQPRSQQAQEAPRQAPQQVSQSQQYQQYQKQQIPQSYQDPRVPQDRGRQLQREPQYEQPPIPMGYNLVRGDGNMVAPTNYNPRGLQRYAGPPSNDPRTYQQPQQYPPQALQASAPQQPYPLPVQQSQAVIQPQFVTQNPNLTPAGQHHSQSPPSNRQMVTRPLSSEDLLARSPARPQFGQQAPYQLTLPDQDDDDTEEEIPPVSAPKSLPLQKQSPVLNTDLEMTPKMTAARNFAGAGQINTNVNGNGAGKLSQPALRHPMSPATYPLPENTMFSPINPTASQIPPPPPPKNWPQSKNDMLPQTPEPKNGLDRSNTINTNASEISQLSGPRHDSLSVPRTQEQVVNGNGNGNSNGNGNGNGKRLQQETSPPITPQITPERSPEMKNTSTNPQTQARQNPGDEEDIYDAPPPARSSARALPAIVTRAVPAVTLPATRIDTSVGSRPGTSSAQEKQLAESPDQRARRRAEQEEKILVDNGHPTTRGDGLTVEDDERATMSATSYPGQEWNPYGNYESWDD